MQTRTARSAADEPCSRSRTCAPVSILRARHRQGGRRRDLRAGAGETLAIVGESGCGKSITALSLMRLVPDPPGRIVGGAVRLDGRDLLSSTKRRCASVRGNDISMIFQEPMTSLNPVMTIGRQIAEALLLHREHEPARQACDARGRDAATWSASPSRSSAPRNIRTSSPAACASAP